jgi:ribosome-associated protein
MSSEQTIKRDIQKLQRIIVDALEGVKGQDIQVFNTEALSPLFERVVVASGTSNRQTRALAMAVRDAVKDEGLPKPRVEGEDNGEWIIVDCGTAVVHVMQPVIRQYYRLEELWGETPVRLGRAGPKAGSTHSETFAREVVAAGSKTTRATKEIKEAKAVPVKKSVAKAAAKTSKIKAPEATLKAVRVTQSRKASAGPKVGAGVSAAVKATVKAQPTNKAEAARPTSKVSTKVAAKKVTSAKANAPVKSSAKRVVITAAKKPTVKTVVVAKPNSRTAAKAAPSPARSASARPASKTAAARKPAVKRA